MFLWENKIFSIGTMYFDWYRYVIAKAVSVYFSLIREQSFDIRVRGVGLFQKKNVP